MKHYKITKEQLERRAKEREAEKESGRGSVMANSKNAFPLSAPINKTYEVTTERDPATGTITFEAWYKDGHPIIPFYQHLCPRAEPTR